MNGDSSVSLLMFFTLVAGLVIITGVFLMHLRSSRNRDIAANALAGDSKLAVGVTANGALPDLIGIGVFALIAMGLLTLGYSEKSNIEKVQPMPQVGQTMPAAPSMPSADPTATRASPAPNNGSGMAQPPGTSAEPKIYKPTNPDPDPRVAPAGTSSGVGASSGGRPEQKPDRK